MTERNINKKRSGLFRAVAKTIGTIIFVFLIFGLGYQFGSGAWNLNFGVSTVKQNKSLPDKLDYKSVDEVYRVLKEKYDGNLDVNKLMLGLKQGLVNAAGDPYTTYMDAEEAKTFDEQLNGFSGIGAELGKQGSDIIVISPIEGFPAANAGIKPKDVIISINDEDANGLSVDEAVRRIRGEAGTTVKLTILRNSQERLEFNIVRDKITIPSVEYKVLDNNIGYIRISVFADDTAGLVSEAASKFGKNIDGLILDLRSNPGGYLNAAVDVSGKWLKDGQVVLKEKRDGKTVKTFTNQGTGQFNGIKTVVLIDEGSASASEITAGALKDNRVAVVYGVKSFGKGSVQELNKFDNGDNLKVTVARWYTPGGKNIDKEGIEPDKTVKISEEDVKNNKDPQLDAAIEYIKS